MKHYLIGTVFTLSALGLMACQQQPHEKTPQSVSPATAAANPITSQKVPDPAHTAENSLDWHGVYQGVLPCADCSGIQTTLTLNSDKSYRLEEKYLDRDTKPFVSVGTFNFDAKQPSLITLDQKAEQRKFFIGEGFAQARAMDGSAIEGVLKPHYQLKKIR